MTNKIILAVLLMSMLASCTTLLKSTEDLANIAIINDKITSGEVASTIKYVELSQTDILIVDHAINSFLYFADTWKKQIIFLDASTNLFSDFLSSYSNMVIQYSAVENVIARNWDKYPLAQQTELLDYQRRAKKANSAVDSLVRANRINEAIIDSILLAQIFAGVVIK